jgi:hypothetical protein
MSHFRFVWPLILAAGPCLGQSWEVGAAGGYGIYHYATIANGPASANAGFKSGVDASGVLGQNVSQYFGGELRYTFQNGAAELKSGGQKVSMDASSHAVHYDFLIYATPKHSKFRPYAAGGAGVKWYNATGQEFVAQPLSNFAFLTRTHEVKALISFGAGVKIALNDHWLVRADFRDYATPFPEKLFAPAPGSKIHGWLHDFVPLLGVDWTFGKP